MQIMIRIGMRLGEDGLEPSGASRKYLRWLLGLERSEKVSKHGDV
jgi:hypothetical protein